MFQALRTRDFRLLWGGSVISALGTWLLVLAIPAHVLLVTGSLRDTGLTLGAQYLPYLILGPVAGVVTDRWDRRRLMIATSLFRAGAVAVMLLGTSPSRYWVLYAALIAESSGGVLYTPAWQARTPAIVGTGTLLSSANSLNALADGAVRLVGGPLGGILLTALGVKWLICADALSYLASAAANTLTSRPPAERPAAGKTPPGAPAAGQAPPGPPAARRTTVGGVFRDLAEGGRVLRGQPAARALLLVTVIFLAANAALSAMLIPLGIQRLGGSKNTGFVLSGLGVGFLLAGPLLRALLDRVQPRTLLTACLAATAVGQFGLFTSTSLATALPAAVAIGTFGSMSEVIPQTAVQRIIPNAVLGRVSAVFLTGEAAVGLLGSVAGPFLAQAAHLAGLAAIASLVTVSAAALTSGTVPRLPTLVPRSADTADPIPHAPPTSREDPVLGEPQVHLGPALSSGSAWRPPLGLNPSRRAKNVPGPVPSVPLLPPVKRAGEGWGLGVTWGVHSAPAAPQGPKPPREWGQRDWRARRGAAPRPPQVPGPRTGPAPDHNRHPGPSGQPRYRAQETSERHVHLLGDSSCGFGWASSEACDFGPAAEEPDPRSLPPQPRPGHDPFGYSRKAWREWPLTAILNAETTAGGPSWP